MYIRLSDNALLRGWLDMTRTVVGRTTLPDTSAEDGLRLRYKYEQRPLKFTREEYQFVKRLDGQTDFPALDEAEQAVLEKLMQHGFVQISESPLPPLSYEQLYLGYKTLHLRSCTWSVTGKCNYRCKHCILSAPEGKHPQLSLDQCRELVQQIADCGVRSVILTGGEPLLRPDFPQIVDMLTERDICIQTIMSNGRFVTDALLDHLGMRGQHPSFQISFDGTNGGHDWLRGVEGAEQDAIRAIKLLISRGFYVTASMCMHKGNAATLRDTAKLMGELGVEQFSVGAPQKLGLWSDRSVELGLSTEEQCEICCTYIPQYFADGSPVSIAINGLFVCEKHGTAYRVEIERGFDSAEELSGVLICSSARNNPYISAEGQLMPCLGYAAGSFAEEFPSLFDKPLREALMDSLTCDILCTRFEKYLERNEKCRNCEKLLKCAGGCRACGLAGGGDHLCIDEATCALHLGGCAEKVREVADRAIAQLGLEKGVQGEIPRAFAVEN